jgi:hypothetical protein
MQQNSALTCLTLQLFFPKLHQTNQMQAIVRQTTVRILLFTVVFLTAQFHFCADLTATPSASHICPICSAVGSVVATQTPNLAIVPVTNCLEVAPLVVRVSLEVPRATSPRAPPAL